jgi:hypothetical protein
MAKYETTEDILAAFNADESYEHGYFKSAMKLITARAEMHHIKETEPILWAKFIEIVGPEIAKTKEYHDRAERGVMLMLSRGIEIELIARVLGITGYEISCIQAKYKDSDFLKDLS